MTGAFEAPITRYLAFWTSGGGINPVSEAPDPYTAMASSAPAADLESAQALAITRARRAGIDTWARVALQIFDPYTGRWDDLERWHFDERTRGTWLHERVNRGDPLSPQFEELRHG